MCDASDVRLPNARLRERGAKGKWIVSSGRAKARRERRKELTTRWLRAESWKGTKLGGPWEMGRGPACVEEKREEKQTVDMDRRGKV